MSELHDALAEYFAAKDAATKAGARMFEAEKRLKRAWNNRTPEPYSPPPFDWKDIVNTRSSCPRGCPVGTLCGDPFCPMRVPIATYVPFASAVSVAVDDAIATGTGVLSARGGETVVVKDLHRTGCTCPPGQTSAACPDPTCPWKPR